MEKYFALLPALLEKLTFARAFAFGFLVLFLVLGFVGYNKGDIVVDKYLSARFVGEGDFVGVGEDSQRAIKSFTKKYNGLVAYTVVLKFDFAQNTRTPLFRSFNDAGIATLVQYEVSRGNIGSLAIFIRDEAKNNNQMISLIQGEFSCSPTGEGAGGVTKVFPDVAKSFVMGCRVPIPPAFGGGGARGYITAHLTRLPSAYELEALKLDLMTLSMYVYNTDVEKKILD